VIRLGLRLLLHGATCGILVVTACGTEPEDRWLFGTYTLVAVEGGSLPQPEPLDPACSAMISEGQLILRLEGAYSLETSGPYSCPEGQTGTLGRIYNGSFTRSGESLNFTVVFPGSGTVEFPGQILSPGNVEVTVPPIPPTEGSDLNLRFEVSP
jgi:hypothetical protein